MRLPIRLTLPILIVIPIFAAVVLTAWSAYQSEKKVVQELAEEMSRKASRSIEQHIDSYLADSKVLYQTMIATSESNPAMAGENARDILEDTLWNLVQQPDLPNRIFFSNPRGDYLGFSKEGDGSWTTQIRNEETVPNRLTYRLDEQRNRGELIQTQVYDPRVRVWYKLAVERGEFTWSPVYAFATEPTLGVTAAQPVYDAQNNLRGVFGLDVSLANLGHFLEDLEISPSGHAFVMERSGELIATSLNAELFRVVDGKKHRIPSTDSDHALVNSIANQLLDELGSFEAVNVTEEFILNAAGLRQYVGVSPVTDEAGIDWLVVVMVPSSDFSAVMTASLRSTIQVGLMVALGASLMGVIVARWITQPILQLTRAACQIEAEKFDSNSLRRVVRRQDELGHLARIFQDMASVVSSRQQSLQQQLQHMKQEHAQQSRRNAQLAQMGNVLAWQDLVGRSRNMRNALAIANHPPLSERLKNVSYFEDFTSEQRQRLLEFGHEQQVEAGTDICRAGDQGTELYFLVDGGAEVLTDEHPPRYLTTIRAGDLVGEFALLLDVPRVAHVRAIAPTILFVVSRDGLRQLLNEYPELEGRILNTLQKRQDERQSLFENLTVIQDPDADKEQNYLDWVRDHLKSLISGD